MNDARETPPPPRSPLREDEPDAPMEPIEGAQDPGPQVQRVTKDEGPEEIPPITRDPEFEQDEDERDLQEENAETTMDQPSQ